MLKCQPNYGGRSKEVGKDQEEIQSRTTPDPGCSLFLAGDQKAARNEQNSMTKTQIGSIEEPFGAASKKITGELKYVWRYQPQPYLLIWIRHIDANQKSICFDQHQN